MTIRTARRVSQIFFVLLLVWFCVAATLGDRFWQLRGWPVNWLLELDPLAGLATLLATRTLYAGLLWGLATVALTVVLGRVFCGWVCPFGALHQFVGWLGRRRLRSKLRVEANRYRPAQRFKYYVLAAFLAAAALAPLGSGTLLIGLLDPLPLVQRSVSLVLLPLAERSGALALSPLPRFYDGAGLIAAVFATALALNLWVPRFYCRFVCPLGALARPARPLRALAHRPHRGGLHGLPEMRTQLRGRLPPDRADPDQRVRHVRELPGRLRARGHRLPHPPVVRRREPAARPAPPRVPALGRDRSGRRADAAAGRRHRAELEPGSHPAARRARGGGLPGALHQVRPVHARLPDQRDPARPASKAGWRACGRRG